MMRICLIFAVPLWCLTPVAFTAASARLCEDPPGARRAFLDRGVLGLEPAYLRTLAGYAEALRQKNRLLSRREAVDRRALSAFNVALAAKGRVIVERRQAYLENAKKNFRS